MHYSDEEMDEKWQRLRPSFELILNRRKQKRQQGWTIAACLSFIILSSFTYVFMAKTVISTLNEVVTVSLPDGSTVTLNHQSSISYPKFGFNWRPARNVSLHGESYFEVTKNPEQPFIIESPHLTTSVLGTSFNVKDFSTHKNAEVHVAEGKVRVKSTTGNHENILIAHEKTRLSGQKLHKSIDNNANAYSWKTGKISFENCPLSELAKDLSTYLRRPVVVANDQIAQKKFTGKFDHASEASIIQTLEFTLNLKVIKHKNRITISK